MTQIGMTRIRYARTWLSLPALATLAIVLGLSAAGRAAGFTLTTDAFPDNGPIPAAYTCSGENQSPALQWTDAPDATRSFALIVADPDAPGGEFVHWVLYDLPKDTTSLPRGVPTNPRLTGGARQGTNDFRRIGYGGPCPPPGPAHRYIFTLYAVDLPRLPVPEGATREQVSGAMKGHIIAMAVLTGRFRR